MLLAATSLKCCMVPGRAGSKRNALFVVVWFAGLTWILPVLLLVHWLRRAGLLAGVGEGEFEEVLLYENCCCHRRSHGG